MTPIHLTPQYHRMAVWARVLAVLILGVPAVVLGDSSTLSGLVAIAAVWLAATLAEWIRSVGSYSFLAEAALIGVVAGISLDGTLALVAALAIPPFTAGLRRGVLGVGLAISIELVTLLFIAVPRIGALPPAQASSTITAMLTGLGLGLIASYLHSTVLTAPQDPLAPYREAQKLIRELLDLSGDLRSGLDPVTLGSRIAVEVRNEIPVAAVAVYLTRGDELTPLVSGAVSSRVDKALLRPLAERAVREGRVIDEERFALALRHDDDVVAVVSGMLAAGRDEAVLGVEVRLQTLSVGLAGLALKLDTAMQFARLRDAATAGERRRLARDLHDGVAQDIASLGYLVDALAASPSPNAQAEGLQKLRDRISTVVAQVRLSVQTLRTEMDGSESLGAAISGLARHLSESSGVPIRVTANERTQRLRPEVEAELLRIAQEAMTNAVRHADASLIDVDCRVAAPHAEITVRDDGHGMGTGRPDSYGLAIMRERADLIDAEFSIEPAQPRGTRVTVRVPSRGQGPSTSTTATFRPDKVTA